MIKNFPKNIDFKIHENNGGMFSWLWCKNLTISDLDVYQKLKEKGVLVVPGSYFFFGEKTAHSSQCFRISLTASEDEIIRGFKVIGEVLEKCVNKKSY